MLMLDQFLELTFNFSTYKTYQSHALLISQLPKPMITAIKLFTRALSISYKLAQFFLHSISYLIIKYIHVFIHTIDCTANVFCILYMKTDL